MIYNENTQRLGSDAGDHSICASVCMESWNPRSSL